MFGRKQTTLLLSDAYEDLSWLSCAFKCDPVTHCTAMRGEPAEMGFLYLLLHAASAGEAHGRGSLVLKVYV